MHAAMFIGFFDRGLLVELKGQQQRDHVVRIGIHAAAVYVDAQLLDMSTVLDLFHMAVVPDDVIVFFTMEKDAPGAFVFFAFLLADELH